MNKKNWTLLILNIIKLFFWFIHNVYNEGLPNNQLVYNATCINRRSIEIGIPGVKSRSWFGLPLVLKYWFAYSKFQSVKSSKFFLWLKVIFSHVILVLLLFVWTRSVCVSACKTLDRFLILFPWSNRSKTLRTGTSRPQNFRLNLNKKGSIIELKTCF